MTHSQINVTKRTLFGNLAKKLYRTGQVPATVYGKIEKAVSIELSIKEFIQVYKVAGENHVVDVILDGKKIPTIIQALDINPLTNKLRNIDFKAVDLKQKTTAEVPVELEGIAPCVKNFGGLVSLKLETIEVEALPDKLPEKIIIDITCLETLEDNIFVKDIIIKGDFIILDDLDTPVVVVETETVEVIEEATEEVVAVAGTEDIKK